LLRNLCLPLKAAQPRSVAAPQALRAGADDYVAKPYKRSELIERIKAQLRVRDGLEIAAASGVAGALTAASSGLGGSGKAGRGLGGLGVQHSRCVFLRAG